jgi:hypothetical protein
VPAAALTHLYDEERMGDLIDELIRKMAQAGDARSTAQSPSFSRRAWLAARDEAVDRFVKRVFEEFPPPPNAGPEIEMQLRTLADDLARESVAAKAG